MEDSKLSLINGNTLEIHYYFLDDSHTMDAFVQNKCDNELLGIIKEVAGHFSVELTVETEPLASGGLRKWLKIISKKEGKNATITTATIAAIVVSLLINPLGKVGENLVDKLFEDKEMVNLEKEKKKLEIEKLKQEVQKNKDEIEANNLIKRKKSNFYESLDKYSKVKMVSFSIADDEKRKVLEEKSIQKAEFKNYVLVTDAIAPIVIENAEIEIVSPVLKKGDYKWTGYYLGELISFSMKSKEFKESVQKGAVEFRNGSSINCVLHIKRKIDSEGVEKIIGYDVFVVNHHSQNGSKIETIEGKKHRRNKNSQGGQIDLFSYLDE